MLFKDFCISSYGGHFVQQNGTICALLVEGMMYNICNLGQWFRRYCLKAFVFLDPVANLFSGVKPFVCFW